MFNEPGYHQHEEFINRKRKLQEIKECKIDPYPPEYRITCTAASLQERYEDQSVGMSEDAEAGKTPHVKLAGRLVLFRSMGKNAFGHILDHNAKLQVMFNRDHTLFSGFASEELSALKFIEKKIDLGDIIGIEGHVFRTHKGELTVYAKKVTLLCKTLLPLPDKYSGINDKEMRYRKRWLDLISHPEIYQTFFHRSRLQKLIREHMSQEGFMEVETPVLQNIYGGAAAKPFTTHINALDKQEMFLRISLEIPLKELIIGGFPKVFEMGKVFRNEGIDRNHNPEFTMMEAYAAYWDYNDMMRFVENLFEKLTLALHGTTKVAHTLLDGKEVIIDMKAPWKRLSMKESIREYAALDVDALSYKELQHILIQDCQLPEKEVAKLSKGELVAKIFEEKVESHLLQPHHITDHPIETTPLCKPHRNPQKRAEGLVERFESYIFSHEICNSYSELNDPELQRKLLLQQAEKKAQGDEEASPLDEEFIEAICQGMPPCAGIGIGIDRLVMLLTNSYSIRDVLLFPLMKPPHS